MKNLTGTIDQLASTTKRLGLGLVSLGAKRFELVSLEMQEVFKHLLHFILLACGLSLVMLFAFGAFTFLLVALFWSTAPIIVLAVLAAMYTAIGYVLWLRLCAVAKMLRACTASYNQIQKDLSALASSLS
jgi:uncharacterized membrane protein YqjE